MSEGTEHVEKSSPKFVAHHNQGPAWIGDNFDNISERSLFVWNINYDTTEPELKDIFLSFGPARIKLMMDPNTNKNKGHAFVEYQEPAPATEAVKNLNGHFIRDTKIRVQFNTKQPPWYATNGQRRHSDNHPSNSVYVRNLDNNITQADVENYFSKFGSVKVSLVVDHVTRRNKGYAFVDYPSIEEAAAAITACNGTVLHGRQLHVEFSNKGGGSDGRRSESVSSVSDYEGDKSRDPEFQNLKQQHDNCLVMLEEAKLKKNEEEVQSIREKIWEMSDKMAKIKLADSVPPRHKHRSREEKRKKKRKSDEPTEPSTNYYSDDRENTPGSDRYERSYTPSSSGRRSHNHGSVSSDNGDEGYLEYRVFVGGLNHFTTPETFKTVFSKYGKISSYFLKWDKYSSKNKGFGFVSYDTSEQLDGLLATHKDRPVVIDGNEVNIKRVFPDPESAPPTPPEPQSYQVPPFPLGIPPMVCKQAPAFTQPPTYCDDNTPLPDDIKTVAFFYNLGIHHYNLLRIFVYHWNLLFPGVMPPTSPKMDSTPPNRQQAPATTQITPPSFGMERGPSMERPMGHTAMGHPGMMGGPRHMYQQNYGQRYPMQYMDYSKQNQYNRNFTPLPTTTHKPVERPPRPDKPPNPRPPDHTTSLHIHELLNMRPHRNHNHYNGKRGGYHNQQYNNMRGDVRHGQGDYYRGDTNMHHQREWDMQNNHRPMAPHPKPQKVSNSSQVSFSPPSAETFSPTSDSPSHSSPPSIVQEKNKEVNNSRSSYGSHEDTLTYEPHEAEPNFLAELESLQQHGEHGQHVPHSVSSQHVTHSRPENILRRSHSEGTQSMRPQGGEIPRPPGMEHHPLMANPPLGSDLHRTPTEIPPRGAPVEMPRSVHNLARSRSSSGQTHEAKHHPLIANPPLGPELHRTPVEMPRGPVEMPRGPVEMPRGPVEMPRGPVEMPRGTPRSTSGQTNEVLHSYFITNGEYPDAKAQEKPFYPPPMPGFESLPPRIHQRLSEKPPPKEMDQLLRNFQLPMGFPASNTGFQVPEYNAEKGRIDNMPPNYNPMQFLSMLQHNQMMPQHPAMQIPQRQNSRFTQSPTPSEEESEEDKKINLEKFR